MFCAKLVGAPKKTKGQKTTKGKERELKIYNGENPVRGEPIARETKGKKKETRGLGQRKKKEMKTVCLYYRTKMDAEARREEGSGEDWSHREQFLMGGRGA